MNISSHLTHSLIIGLIICFIGGCSLQFQDVTNEPKYSKLVGTEYLLKKDMVIYGINLPPGYSNTIHLYTIHQTYPTIKGREMVTEDILPSKTILKVKGVRESNNHIPGFPSIDAIVAIETYEKQAGVPITIELRYLLSTDYTTQYYR